MAVDSSKKYRLLEVIPKKKKGDEVIVRYYEDTFDLFSDIKILEKEDVHKHITTSIEVNLEKYNYTEDSLLNVLRNKFEGDFYINSYGKSNESMSQYSDSDFYRKGEKTFIVKHKGNREDRKNLEFFIDKEKEKQIFIRNDPKRFKPRTQIIKDIDRLEKAKSFLEKELVDYDILPEDIKINERRKYVELKCEENVLSFLDETYFRINAYESKEFKNEKEAESFFEEVKSLPDYKDHVDQARVIHKKKNTFDIKYVVRLTSDKNKDFLKALKKKDFKPFMDKKGKKEVHAKRAREELWDPLELGSPTKQLRDFYPPHNPYNPEKPLSEQVNKGVPRFSHYLSDDYSELEKAIDSAYDFYLKKSAVIDLEVTDYDVNEKNKVTGNIFMAVLNSETENKIYMTKTAWVKEEHKEHYENNKKNKDVKLVFVDDEIDLIAKLEEDSKKYEFIIGHNFEDYDQKHMIKFNGSHKSFEGLPEEQFSKLKEYKKGKNGKLWSKPLKKILDTKKYVARRIPILENHKLATFAGFDKSIDYNEMELLLKSKDPNKILKIINYTIDDGTGTNTLKKIILKNSILESFACNKTVPSVFKTTPLQNFYEATSRDYFMKMGTYKTRHEFSPFNNLQKLKERESPDDLLWSLLKNEKQTEGIMRGKLVFPDVMMDACEDIIQNNQVMKLINQKMKHSNNFLEKYDLLQKHNFFLYTAIDKVKNFMKTAGLEFGKKYELEDVFRSLNREDFEDAYFEEDERGISDFELSRTNYIFCAEYKAKRKNERIGIFPIDYTMLEINNKIVDNVEKMSKEIIAKSNNLYVTNNKETGIVLADVHGINFKDKGFVGVTNEYEVFLNRKKSKDDLLRKMTDYFLENNSSQKEIKNKFYNEVYNKGPEYWKKHKIYLRAFLGEDLHKSKGTLSLFY